MVDISISVSLESTSSNPRTRMKTTLTFETLRYFILMSPYGMVVLLGFTTLLIFDVSKKLNFFMEYKEYYLGRK